MAQVKTPAHKSFRNWTIVAIAANVIIALCALNDVFHNASPNIKWFLIALSVGSMAGAFFAYKKAEPVVANRALFILGAFAGLMIWLISSSLYAGS